MPKPHKYSPVSEGMVTRYKGTRRNPRGADLLKLVKDLPPVHESWGACRNTVKKIRRGSRRVPKCKAYRAILGNGLCQDCWDKEIDARMNYHKAKPKTPTNDET